MSINIIGGGLAGCEAAYQVAKRGIKVNLYDMKAMIVIPSGISVTSSFITVILGLLFISSFTRLEKISLSTAKAPPAGTLLLSAHFIRRESNILISSLSIPAALSFLAAFRLFEHTSSHNLSE